MPTKKRDPKTAAADQVAAEYVPPNDSASYPKGFLASLLAPAGETETAHTLPAKQTSLLPQLLAMAPPQPVDVPAAPTAPVALSKSSGIVGSVMDYFKNNNAQADYAQAQSSYPGRVAHAQHVNAQQQQEQQRQSALAPIYQAIADQNLQRSRRQAAGIPTGPLDVEMRPPAPAAQGGTY